MLFFLLGASIGNNYCWFENKKKVICQGYLFAEQTLPLVCESAKILCLENFFHLSIIIQENMTDKRNSTSFNFVIILWTMWLAQPVYCFKIYIVYQTLRWPIPRNNWNSWFWITMILINNYHPFPFIRLFFLFLRFSPDLM